ncbi:MAG: DJ-1/PfpI family protein [Acholeplasmataceae bacterium]
MQEILIYLETEYADWEISHIGHQVKSSKRYDIKIVSKTKEPLISMSGFNIIPDYSVDDILFSDINHYSMLILSGGMYWSKGKFVNETAESLVKLFLMNNKPVAAICDATTFLAFNGYLNDVEHTGNTIQHIIRHCPNYKGHKLYLNKQSVSSNRFITANGTAGLEFTREILKKLEIGSPQEIEAWYQFRKKGIYHD